MPKLRFLVASQNVKNGATNIVVLKETIQLKTVSKVSKVHIQLMSGLVSSNVRVFFCIQKSNSDVLDFAF